MTSELDDLKDIEEEKKNVLDDAGEDDSSAVQTYNITSYGADLDVDGLVKRLKRGDVFIPSFQRDYVWNLSDASRFVESLLLGLPVPGIFLAKEQDSNRMLVIDGQQRLKTLQFFYDGHFNPKPSQKSQRVFKLAKVQPQFENKTYNDLDEKDKIRLNDTVIHATIIKQDSPEKDDTSVYHVFERLNTGGRKLTAQEIRTAIYHGGFNDLLKTLNAVSAWRSIFGKESNRLKDRELVLRFLAMYFEGDAYAKPMNDFLSKFNKKHRNPDSAFVKKCTDIFSKSITAIYEAIGERAFRPERALNAAVFDSVMVAVARCIDSTVGIKKDAIKYAYDTLLVDLNYKNITSQSTSDTTSVSERLKLATDYFLGTRRNE